MSTDDLHGNAPDTAPVALLLIDVVNDLEFEGGDQLLPRALPAAQKLAALRARCRQRRIPTVYVNDNFGHWQSNLQRLTDHCLRSGVRGKPIVEALLPEDDDYFVLKPKHSGFYATPLELLLTHFGARRLILGGFTVDRCVLFTAQDAYLRDYELFVPEDCVAAIEPEDERRTLEHLRRVLRARTAPSGALDLDDLLRQPEEDRPHGAP